MIQISSFFERWGGRRSLTGRVDICMMSTMGLNIKKQETHQLASELAALTGETMTEAITVALRERLGRLRRERDVPAILKAARAMLDDLPSEEAPDHAALLYDEWGLPA